MEIASKRYCFLIICSFILPSLQTQASAASAASTISIVSHHGYYPVSENTSSYCNFGMQSSSLYDPFLPALSSRIYGPEFRFGINQSNAYPGYWISLSQRDPSNVLNTNLSTEQVAGSDSLGINFNKSIFVEQLGLDHYYRELTNIVIQHNYDQLVHDNSIEVLYTNLSTTQVSGSVSLEINENSNRSKFIENLDLDHYYGEIAKIILQHNYDELVHDMVIQEGEESIKGFDIGTFTAFSGELDESLSISYCYSPNYFGNFLSVISNIDLGLLFRPQFQSSVSPNKPGGRKLLVDTRKTNARSRFSYVNNICQLVASIFLVAGIFIICIQLQTSRDEDQVTEGHDQVNTDDQEDDSNIFLISCCSKYYLFGGLSSSVGILIFLVRFVFERAGST